MVLKEYASEVIIPNIVSENKEDYDPTSFQCPHPGCPSKGKEGEKCKLGHGDWLVSRAIRLKNEKLESPKYPVNPGEPKNPQDKVKSRYIFNESEVQKEKLFPFIQFSDVWAYGVLLPKEVQETDKSGNLIGDKQIEAPVLIDSDNRLHEVGEDFCKRFKTKFGCIPKVYPRRWSLEGIRKYLDGGCSEIDGKKIFERIKGLYEEQLYFQSGEWYEIHALWDMGTYLFLLFPYFPIFELRGMKGTAKNKIMAISRGISFNATEEMTNPSESSLFRLTHERRPAKYIDEAEKLFQFKSGKVEGDNRAELINASYKYTGTVSRSEKIGNKFEVCWYNVYSPTMVASINGLFGATEDRAIIHVTTKAPKGDDRSEKEPNPEDFRFQEIRDDLYAFSLKNATKLKRAYGEMKSAGNLKGRNFWIWKPLLVLAKYLDEGLYARMMVFAEKLSQIKDDISVPEGSMDYKILEAVHGVLNQGTELVLIKDILARYDVPDGVKKPSSKAIGTHLDRMGFLECRLHSRTGNGFRIPIELFKQICSSLCPSIFSSLPSLASQYDEPSNSNCEESVKLREEKTKRCEVRDSREANMDVKDVVILAPKKMGGVDE